MEIELKDKYKTTEFRKLNPGDPFGYNDRIFIKVYNPSINLREVRSDSGFGVNLMTGDIVYFNPREDVAILNGKFVET